MIQLHRFRRTGGWSLWIGGHVHIYYFPGVLPRWRRLGITFAR